MAVEPSLFPESLFRCIGINVAGIKAAVGWFKMQFERKKNFFFARKNQGVQISTSCYKKVAKQKSVLTLKALFLIVMLISGTEKTVIPLFELKKTLRLSYRVARWSIFKPKFHFG
jgi:hypothetical protein